MLFKVRNSYTVTNIDILMTLTHLFLSDIRKIIYSNAIVNTMHNFGSCPITLTNTNIILQVLQNLQNATQNGRKF